jgi:MFS transporter, YQGE family, putative transporter
MSSLIKKIVAEYHHFLVLSHAARKLLLSFTFFEVVEPLIFSFINAFVFRQTDSFLSVVIYNVGQFIFIPLFFYINGWLMKVFSIKNLYLAGLIGQGLGLLVVFFVPIVGTMQLFLFGCALGIAIGLYWANRNFISLEITSESTRTYFVGLEQIAWMITGLVMPLLIGGVISLGDRYGWYQPIVAYQVMGVLGMIVLLLAGKVLGAIKVDNPQPEFLLVTKLSSQWWYVRLAEVSYGVFHGGFMFLPTLMVFKLLGEEGVLGLLQSVAAGCTAVVLYYFSRKLKAEQRLVLVSFAILVLMIASISVSWLFTGLAAIFLLVIATPVNNIRWLGWSPTVMDAIDAQDGGDPVNNYAYVVDREIFLNVGRLIGVAVFVGIITYFSDLMAIRFQPLVIAVFQLLFIFAMKQVATFQPKVVLAAATLSKKK